MNTSSQFYVVLLVGVVTVLTGSPCRVSAQLGNVSATGPITIDAKDSEARPGSVVYHAAHVTMNGGTTLDADELKAIETVDNKLKEATATGNVKAFVTDPADGRSYTVTADSAVFDPVTNTIDLEGNVKTIVKSSYTIGPLVQTGSSATVYLGKGPDYPQIDMRQVHTVLTVKP